MHTGIPMEKCVKGVSFYLRLLISNDKMVSPFCLVAWNIDFRMKVMDFLYPHQCVRIKLEAIPDKLERYNIHGRMRILLVYMLSKIGII